MTKNWVWINPLLEEILSLVPHYFWVLQQLVLELKQMVSLIQLAIILLM